MSDDAWMHCSACKTDIFFGMRHWVCSVSTCNRNRTRLVFCSVACWDSHLADARHRDAGAVEMRAPSRAPWEAEQEKERDRDRDRDREDSARAAPTAPATAAATGPTATSPAATAPRRIVGAPPPAPAPSAFSNVALSSNVEREVLIVVSKMKKYIKDRSGMNTSDAVAEALSDHVRQICDDAI